MSSFPVTPYLVDAEDDVLSHHVGMRKGMYMAGEYHSDSKDLSGKSQSLADSL